MDSKFLVLFESDEEEEEIKPKKYYKKKKWDDEIYKYLKYGERLYGCERYECNYHFDKIIKPDFKTKYPKNNNIDKKIDELLNQHNTIEKSIK